MDPSIIALVLLALLAFRLYSTGALNDPTSLRILVRDALQSGHSLSGC